MVHHICVSPWQGVTGTFQVQKRACASVVGPIQNLSVFTDAESGAGVAGDVSENLCVLSDAEGPGVERVARPQDFGIFPNLQQVQHVEPAPLFRAAVLHLVIVDEASYYCNRELGLGRKAGNSNSIRDMNIIHMPYNNI